MTPHHNEQTVYAAPILEIKTLPTDVHTEIRKVHNSTIGHHGVDKTLRKLLRADKKWQYMREHIRFFIK
jgi:hypothetical protein